MATVRKSMNQFTSFLDNEALPLNSEQPRQKLPITDTDRSPSVGNFSPKAIDFLEKFDRRKQNKLLELSNMKLPDAKEQSQIVQITENPSNLQTIC